MKKPEGRRFRIAPTFARAGLTPGGRDPILVAMKELRQAVSAALAVLASALPADAARIALDLRPPAPAVRTRGAAPSRAATQAPEDGTLRKTELPAGATDAPVLEVGDELSLALFDDAGVELVLRERTESPLGGETFLAGPAEGDLTAVVLQTGNGLSIEALDADSGQSFSVVSTQDGVTVRERETPDAADEGCLEVVEENPVPDSGAGPSAAEQPDGCVDVLVAFDRPAAAWARESGGGTADFATMAVQKMNLALANSGLGTTFRFRLVGTLEVPASAEGDLESVLDWTRDGTGVWKAVKEERDRVGADVVTTLVDTGSSYGVTGIAFGLRGSDLSAYSGSAYSACAIRAVARAHTMTHECGHNLGAGHATAVNTDRIAPGPQLHGYSAGHFFTGSDGVPYHTIMAYNWDGFGNSYDLAPLFSSPSLTWAGAAAGDAKHDNVRTIRQTWSAASAWRSTKVPASWDVFFSPEDGTPFEGSIEVTLSPGKAGVEIRYTLDGSDPTPSSPLYDGPIVLTEPATIRAATVADGALGPVFKAYYGPDPVAEALGTPRLRWTNSVDYPWIVQSEMTYNGGTALRSGWIGEYAHGPSDLTAVMDCPTNTMMSFRYRKNFATESFFAVFDEPADRSEEEKCIFVDRRSGTSYEWTLAECEIPAGRRRVRFYFYQGGWHYVDENLVYMFNGVWLDDVKFDALSRPPSIRPASSADETKARTFSGALEITLVPPDGREGVLWYSTDGSDPAIAGGIDVGGEDSANLDPRSGTIYTGPFTITESTRVRATFVEPGLERSVPVEARFLERHAIGPGEWTADAAGARAGVAADPDARLVAVMLSEGRTDGDCEAFLPVSRDPGFLEWCRTNGVYLVVSDGETQAESIAAGDWFWALHDIWTNDPVARIPGIYFVRPSDLWTPLAEGIAIADGAHSVGSVVYDGTAESLVAGFASVLETKRTAPRLKPVYRMYSPSGKDHFLTANRSERDRLRETASWKYENVAFYAYSGDTAGTIPLHRFYSAKRHDHHFTVSESEKRRLQANPDWKYEGVACWVASSARPGTTPVHRFFSASANDHFLTAGTAEADRLGKSTGWKHEGIPFSAWPDAGRENIDEQKLLQPVFRFYSPGAKDHFLTIGEAERFRFRTEGAKAWRYEGIAFYAYPSKTGGTVPLHRFYSSRLRDHFFTASESEARRLRNNPSWKYEGAACWVSPSAQDGTVPVYRFWSSSAGDHLLTAGAAEAARFRATKGWTYEGTPFQAWTSAP